MLVKLETLPLAPAVCDSNEGEIEHVVLLYCIVCIVSLFSRGGLIVAVFFTVSAYTQASASITHTHTHAHARTHTRGRTVGK